MQLMVQQRNEAPKDLCTRDQDKEKITKDEPGKKTNNAKEGKPADGKQDTRTGVYQINLQTEHGGLTSRI
ncbi:hypothetical protein HanXRQr2_Chr03g0132351 [Helianthus annuus]|uniref:Uncharacterized protein n=1 Tax=Helianthus annuus TaxID=4232 RepID=A0A9K3JJR9_HELAN|nr:hypothetical protein HanXRQr2_Chr03g0132351 [Helianthus annuus]